MWQTHVNELTRWGMLALDVVVVWVGAHAQPNQPWVDGGWVTDGTQEKWPPPLLVLGAVIPQCWGSSVSPKDRTQPLEVTTHTHAHTLLSTHARVVDVSECRLVTSKSVSLRTLSSFVFTVSKCYFGLGRLHRCLCVADDTGSWSQGPLIAELSITVQYMISTSNKPHSTKTEARTWPAPPLQTHPAATVQEGQ